MAFVWKSGPSFPERIMVSVSRVFPTIRLGGLFAALLCLAPRTAQAAPTYGLTRSTASCASLAASAGFRYTDCRGSFAGNNMNQSLTAVLASFDGGTLAYAGSSNDAGGFGPFTSSPTESTGTLAFDTPITTPFALMLKAGNAFSLYYFANPTQSISSLSFQTTGVAVNSNRAGLGLSHASLYLGASAGGNVQSVVAEPAAVGLLGMGLLGLRGLARWRSRRVSRGG